MEGMIDSIEKFCDEVETINEFCCSGERPNASGGCEATVTQKYESVGQDSDTVESRYVFTED